ncbi:MAG TPA: hypothetical protein VK983_00605 [Candidatus Limnocylindrales bacterium]|nr:hypothetical protein [Candidatus Limnocylindrales bacterium]
MPEELHVVRPHHSPIRRVVDPERRLPDIALIENNQLTDAYTKMHKPHSVHGYEIATRDGFAGWMAVVEDTDSDACYFANIELDENYLRSKQGIGLAAYVLAIETAHAVGRRFRTGQTVSEPAKHRWEGFVDLGVAQVHELFEYLGNLREGSAYSHYLAHVDIPPLT